MAASIPSTPPKRFSRISFTTKVVAPSSLPPFAYIPSAIHHDSIEFVASLGDMELVAGQELIKTFWPDAKALSFEVTMAPDRFPNRSMLLTPMGALPPPPSPPRRSFWQRITSAPEGAVL